MFLFSFCPPVHSLCFKFLSYDDMRIMLVGGGGGGGGSAVLSFVGLDICERRALNHSILDFY